MMLQPPRGLHLQCLMSRLVVHLLCNNGQQICDCIEAQPIEKAVHTGEQFC